MNKKIYLLGRKIEADTDKGYIYIHLNDDDIERKKTSSSDDFNSDNVFIFTEEYLTNKQFIQLVIEVFFETGYRCLDDWNEAQKDKYLEILVKEWNYEKI